jgi:ammonium transporter Rh
MTYIASSLLRNGKTSIADMANAALAGGVAIGATCNLVTSLVAFVIGLLAGALSVIGFVLIQPKLQSSLKIVDTAGFTTYMACLDSRGEFMTCTGDQVMLLG